MDSVSLDQVNYLYFFFFFQLSLVEALFSIRSLRMVSDTILTGSDDWTARMWSVSRGTCEAVLPCHAGPILCVEYSPSDKGVITGKSLLLFMLN